MSNVAEITTNVKQNLFQDVSHVKRLAGDVSKRKLFCKIAEDPWIELVDSDIFLDKLSEGNDCVMLQYTGSQRDYHNSISNARYYGISTLKNSVSQSATQIVVTLEHSSIASYQPIKPGDKLWISTQDYISGTGSFEWATVGGSESDVIYSGADVTITIPSGLTYGWTEGAKVASSFHINSVKPLLTGYSTTSVGGGFVPDNNYTVNGVGTIEQDWTITFTSNAAFILSGDVIGSTGTGNTSTNFSPINEAFNKPFFVLNKNGWSGTFSTGDKVYFTTHPASVPIWAVRVVPENSESITISTTSIAISGESA